MSNVWGYQIEEAMKYSNSYNLFLSRGLILEGLIIITWRLVLGSASADNPEYVYVHKSDNYM